MVHSASLRTLATALAVAALFDPAAPLFAQATASVSGSVTYGANGRGISEVMVLVPALLIGSVTDKNGAFSLDGLPAGRHDLIATLLGCHVASLGIDVVPGERSTLAIELSSPAIALEGIEVTALATDIPEVARPFSVGRLEAGRPGSPRTVGGMIQGRVAGAKVIQGSGQPGDHPSVLLRGNLSILGSQDPLVVVDGVITHGSLSEIDPFDVAHVEVLKGAAASASYGARGGAGVIVITTKRGPTLADPVAGPLIVVDGIEGARTLGEIDPADIAQIRRLDGPAAAVLYGPRAGFGVIQVTTVGADPEASRPPFCIAP